MIDRSPNRMHFFLRPKIIGAAALISASVFLVLPILALFSILAGGIVYIVCSLAMFLLCLVGGALLIFGGIGLVVGLLSSSSELAGGGGAIGAVGLVGVTLYDKWNKVVSATAETTFASCTNTAEYITSQLFLGYYVHLWSWSVLIVTVVLALAALGLIYMLRCEVFVKTHLLGIHYTCPSCHRRDVPQFRCPSCSTLASDLAPSPYGIFRTHCGKCHAELPTMDAFGRLSLQKVCQHCSTDLVHPAIGKQHELHFAIIGSQSSGKTTLMVASIWQLSQHYAAKTGFQVNFSNNQQKKTIYNAVKGLASGKRLAKTASMPRPRAFNLAINDPSNQGCLLYLYDTAGEDLTEESRMDGHKFHQFVNGVLLVIDPFAEILARPSIAGVVSRDDLREVNPSATDVACVIQPFMNRLEQRLNVSAEGVFPIPIAVAVTKISAISKMSLAELVEKHPRFAKMASCEKDLMRAGTTGNNSSNLVRQFLSDLGLDNLIQGLESRFQQVAYFVTSAIEELPGTTQPSALPCTAMPLLWLINQTGALATTQMPSQGITTTRHASKAVQQHGNKLHSSAAIT